MGDRAVDEITSRAFRKLTKPITQQELKVELQALHFFDHFDKGTAFMNLFLLYYL